MSSSSSSVSRDLVELGDIDELVRHVDRLAVAGEWDALDEVRDLCRRALDRGKQLWPVSARAEYRLALDAPGAYAARVLVPGLGRFAPGPLSEVAASTHTWDELAPFVAAGQPEPAVAAHERVVRGESLIGDARVLAGVLDVPLELAAWEPAYPVAVYEANRVDFPITALARGRAVELPARGPVVDDGDAVRALLELASAWTSSSDGRSEAVAVRGDALAAVAAFGVARCRVVELSPADAFARMAWTAASGGAHGRRRGMAAGRFGAWWAASALAGLLDDWPVNADDLGEAVAELRWFAWDPGVPDVGWSLRMAVDDPADGLAWALTATDAVLT